MIVCIGCADQGVDQFLNWPTYSPPGCTIFIRSSLVHQQEHPPPTAGVFLLVDLKGIEPSNLTDANRALCRACHILSKIGEKNKNERKGRRTNLFSPVQHAGQGKPAAFSIEEKQHQITLGQKSFLVRLAMSRDFLSRTVRTTGRALCCPCIIKKA